jgi:hypothetical protein
MVEMGGQEALMTINNSAQVPRSNDATLQEYLSEMGGLECQTQVEEQKNSTKISMFNLIMLNKLEKAESRLDDTCEVRKLFDQDTSNGWNI